MPQSNSFLLDTNVFIEPKNRYYPFDICPGYWQLLKANLGGDVVNSITHVYDEIVAGGDELAKWTRGSFKRGCFIDCPSDAAVFSKYIDVAKYVKSLPNKKPNAIQDFLRTGVADPWLVAQAAVYDEVVVTMEVSRLVSPKKVSLVDVCDRFDVRHVDIFTFLRCLNAVFTLNCE